jgi:hypothetical protein
MERSGYAAQFLGRAAARAFCGLLDYWTGPHGPGPSERHPDDDVIDVHHSVPSLSADLGAVQYSWQIKARSTRPKVVQSPVTRCEAFNLRLPRQYIATLRDRAMGQPHFYLALGIPRVGDLAALVDLPVAEQFDWYAVDLLQYFDLVDRRRREGDIDQAPAGIHIPTGNRLTLGMFALLWSGNWVADFYEPLRRDALTAPQPVRDLIETLDRPVAALVSDNSPAVELNAALATLAPYASTDNAVAYSRLAIIASLRAITVTLLRGGRADAIEAYCPEALGGSANLWLFSRAYHEFMRTTEQVGDRNLRLLPSRFDVPSDLPPFQRGVLWYVKIYYQSLAADVKIIRALAEHGGDDYSHYSGVLREFHWVHVDDQGRMGLNERRLSATGLDVEVLRAAESGILVDSGLDLRTGLGFLGIDGSDVKLALPVPNCLFPHEDSFIEHPIRLWHRESYLPLVR